MPTIKGYEFDSKKGNAGSPNGIWYIAQKNNKKYFLKKFKIPKYPSENASKEAFKEKKERCEEFLRSRQDIIKKLKELGDGSGNIVLPLEIFREKYSYYQVTNWVEVNTFDLDDIRKFNDNQKLMILKTLSSAMQKIHSKDIVHGDLKPPNILITLSGSGNPVSKIIDFDDSYFSKKLPPIEETIGTETFFSPELAVYKQGNQEWKEKVTCKSDVFALGIIFHQFWTGSMPKSPKELEDKYIYEVVASGKKCEIFNTIPKWLRNLIEDMLKLTPDERPNMIDVYTAVKSQQYKENTITAKVDVSKLKEIIKKIPKDYSVYYTEKSIMQINSVLNKITLAFKNPKQQEIDSCSELLLHTLNNLERKQNNVNYDKIDRLLKSEPNDLTIYTEETVLKLTATKKLIEKFRGKIEQKDVDILAQKLLVVLKGLKKKEQNNLIQNKNQKTFNINVKSSLPNGYSRVEVINKDQVIAYKSDGLKTTLHKTIAKMLGLIE